MQRRTVKQLQSITALWLATALVLIVVLQGMHSLFSDHHDAHDHVCGQHDEAGESVVEKCFVCDFQLHHAAAPSLFAFVPSPTVPDVKPMLWATQLVEREVVHVNAHSPPSL